MFYGIFPKQYYNLQSQNDHGLELTLYKANKQTKNPKHYELHQIVMYSRTKILHYTASLLLGVSGVLANCNQAEVTGESDIDVD